MPKKHSKRYNSAVKVADLTKEYPLKEAVEILTKFPKAKFDETVELSFRLGVDATARRPDGPRHHAAAEWFRQEGPRPRLHRRCRQGASPPAPIMPVSPT